MFVTDSLEQHENQLPLSAAMNALRMPTVNLLAFEVVTADSDQVSLIRNGQGGTVGSFRPDY